MKLFTVFIFIISLLIDKIYLTCNINIFITRKEDIPKNVFVQVERSDKRISKLIKLNNSISRKKIKVKHSNCLEEKVKVSTLRKYKYEYILIDRKEAFLDGVGSITYNIEENGKIRISQRIGIICSFGDCGNAAG